MSKVTIWHANDLNAANWFMAGLITATYTVKIDTIPSPGSPDFLNLPESLKRILRLDKPDIILTAEIGGVDVPMVSIEVTTTTPQSQHAKQRVPRIVAAAEADVPAIYIIPGKKKSGGSNYSLGADLYWGLQKIRHINFIPNFIFEWPDSNGDLIFDNVYPQQPPLSNSRITDMFKMVRIILQNRLSGNQVRALFSDTTINIELSHQDAKASHANVKVSNFDTLIEIPTLSLHDYLVNNTNMKASKITETIGKLPKRILARENTLIFKPQGRLFDHANDPYSGMLSFFDYAFCRFGRNIDEREKNLIYMPLNPTIFNITDEFAPAGYHAYWKDKCPFKTPNVPNVKNQYNISHHLQYGCVFTKNKPMRILGYFSDLIVFQDSVLVF